MIKIDLGTISPKTALVGGALIVGGIVWLGNKIYNRCKKDRAEFVKFRKEQIAKMEALNLDKLMTEAKEDIKDCIVKLYPTLLSLESDIREGYSYSSIRDSYARYEKICNAIKAGNDVLLKSYVEILNKRAPDGRGGLFESPFEDVDMREHSIWYQMQIYIQNKQ